MQALARGDESIDSFHCLMVFFFLEISFAMRALLGDEELVLALAEVLDFGFSPSKDDSLSPPLSSSASSFACLARSVVVEIFFWDGEPMLLVLLLGGTLPPLLLSADAVREDNAAR